MPKIYKSFDLKKGPDTIRVDVLDDGTIKANNDGISMPNHSNAENFFKSLAALAGKAWNVWAKNKMPAVEAKHTAKERS